MQENTKKFVAIYPIIFVLLIPILSLFLTVLFLPGTEIGFSELFQYVFQDIAWGPLGNSFLNVDTLNIGDYIWMGIWMVGLMISVIFYAMILSRKFSDHHEIIMTALVITFSVLWLFLGISGLGVKLT